MTWGIFYMQLVTQSRDYVYIVCWYSDWFFGPIMKEISSETICAYSFRCHFEERFVIMLEPSAQNIQLDEVIILFFSLFWSIPLPYFLLAEVIFIGPYVQLIWFFHRLDGLMSNLLLIRYAYWQIMDYCFTSCWRMSIRKWICPC